MQNHKVFIKASCLALLLVLLVFALPDSLRGWFELKVSAATTFIVTNTNDSGLGSLRQAILDANASPGTDTISFNIPGTGVHTIMPTSILPVITDPVVIDGYTQPGTNLNALSDGDNAVLLIEVNGSALPSSASSQDGISITAGSSTIRGLAISRFSGAGINLRNNGYNVITGNFLGTDATGKHKLGNTNGMSIFLSADNLIGGTTPDARNIISGNSKGMTIINTASNGQNTGRNTIQGNFIGTAADGTTSLGNAGDGIFMDTPGDLIGGTVAGARNIISGNSSGSGIYLSSGSISMAGNLVQGNYIGTDVTGTVALPNGAGVWINTGANEVIGGTTEAARNVISGNRTAGVRITGSGTVKNQVMGNYIGTDASGAHPLGNGGHGVEGDYNIGRNSIGGASAGAGNVIAFNGGFGVNLFAAPSAPGSNSVRRNSIFSNFDLGIANYGYAAPIITSSVSDGTATTIKGTLTSAANASFTIDFYANSTCDPSGYGEGARYFGMVGVKTDANGTANFSATIQSPLAAGQVITATATDGAGNTSGFSTCDASRATGSVQFSDSDYNVTENAGSIRITILRAGGSTGSLSVSYTISDGSAAVNQNYITTSGTLTFADGETNKNFSVQVLNDGAESSIKVAKLKLYNTVLPDMLGFQNGANLNIYDVAHPAVNPIDDAQTFVTQHYRDFLNREPDQGGLQYWTEGITGNSRNNPAPCAQDDSSCVNARRVGVSAAFFIELEFQATGSYVYRMFKAAYGQRLTYSLFTSDRARINSDAAQLEASKQQYADLFVQRQSFMNKYPQSLTGQQFIDALLQNVQQNSGVDLSGRRGALLDDYAANQSRSRIMRLVADDQSFQNAEYNKAFVLMQYFGYLRRDPDVSGYNFWLDILNNKVPDNFRSMVCAFITSKEYQNRFGSLITRTDKVCSSIGP